MTFEESSGNVFADFRIPDADTHQVPAVPEASTTVSLGLLLALGLGGMVIAAARRRKP